MSKPKIGDLIMIGKIHNRGYCTYKKGEVKKVCLVDDGGFLAGDRSGWFNFDNGENLIVEYIFPVPKAMIILYGVEND